MNPNPRILFVAWQDPRTRAIYPVARIARRENEPGLELVYIAGVHEAQRAGFLPFVGMKRLDATYFTDEVASFPLLSNRLMPASRPDFVDYIERLGLHGRPEPLAILARSEARKATDHLELFAPPEFDPDSGVWIYFAFLRGVRHVDGAEDAIRSLQRGTRLQIERDPDNSWDGNALLVVTLNDQRIGWIPGALLDDFHRLLETGSDIAATVSRVNLPPGPVQQRVLLELRAAPRGDFSPMSSERYQPISQEATPTRIDRGSRL